MVYYLQLQRKLNRLIPDIQFSHETEFGSIKDNKGRIATAPSIIITKVPVTPSPIVRSTAVSPLPPKGVTTNNAETNKGFNNKGKKKKKQEGSERTLSDIYVTLHLRLTRVSNVLAWNTMLMIIWISLLILLGTSLITNAIYGLKVPLMFINPDVFACSLCVILFIPLYSSVNQMRAVRKFSN
jgi:hypothetical protein